MIETTPPNTLFLPFGMHKGAAVRDVPSDYLRWALKTVKFSASLRVAVTEELTRRGIVTAPPERPRPIAPCKRCAPDGGVFVHWMELRNGQRRLRAECAKCHAFLTYPPTAEPYVSMANAGKSATPILDVLTQLEALGIELRSDGKRARVDWPDSQRVPPKLHALIRQCSHELAGLLGNNQKDGPNC